MDPTLLIRIFVDTGGGEGPIATAYPVAQDLILTAHHAVFPQAKTVLGIELRWYWQKDQAREIIQLDPAECIAWNGEKFGVDAVLLKCPFPPGIKNPGRLTKRTPAPGTQWTSQGFAKAVARDGSRPSVAMLGEVIDCNPSGIYQLGVKYSVEDEEHWRGISGGPVFVDDEIIGVFTSCPDNFNATQLRATAARKLLDIPEFTQTLCEEIDEQAEREKRLEWARAEITSLLEEQGADSQLLRQLRDRLDPGKELSTEDFPRISELLLDDCPLAERLDLLNELRVRFHKQKDHRSVECIRALLNVLLPAVFDHRMIALLRNSKDSIAHVAFDARINTETAAEIIMAGGDDRAVSFDLLEQENQLPRGKFNHYKELPPESGFRNNSTKDSYIRDFQDHIIKTFAPGRISESAALRIKQLATRSYDKQTQYCTYKLPDKEADKKTFLELVAEIQVKYPYLVFINLDADETKHLDEIDNMYKVADMQEIKPTETTS